MLRAGRFADAHAISISINIDWIPKRFVTIWTKSSSHTVQKRSLQPNSSMPIMVPRQSQFIDNGDALR